MILATLEEGLRHHRAGRLERAAELYRHVLSADPSQPDALHLLGMAAFSRGAAEARDLVRRAIQAKPNEPVFYANLGIVLESLCDWDGSEACYRRSLELNPRNPAALNSLGNLHRAAWRLDEASACYQAAIQLDARFTAAESNLGNTHADRGEFEQAVACYRRASTSILILPTRGRTWLTPWRSRGSTVRRKRRCTPRSPCVRWTAR